MTSKSCRLLFVVVVAAAAVDKSINDSYFHPLYTYMYTRVFCEGLDSSACKQNITRRLHAIPQPHPPLELGEVLVPRSDGVLLRLLLPRQALVADHAAQREARQVHVLPALGLFVKERRSQGNDENRAFSCKLLVPNPHHHTPLHQHQQHNANAPA